MKLGSLPVNAVPGRERHMTLAPVGKMCVSAAFLLSILKQRRDE
jgi:hypothetical protein